uniref:uncharacterized protein LOC122610605 n=1 Tax=Erigeron canadensis TaxID=72917 RepID=UPI001CB94907|nr:uncharacterized protein LOC122610605 [Erigeron canadensis]
MASGNLDNSSDSPDESNDRSMEFFLNALHFLEDTASSSAPQTRRYTDRRREIGLATLLNDWFVQEPKYEDDYFRKKFRMDKTMFLDIVRDIEANFPYFQERYDARKRKSFTAIQKCTSAVRQLATGNAPDEYDEYLCMTARTARETLDYFCDAIIRLYSREYLRWPTSHEVARIFKAHELRHHMPGMLGSIDCTHVEWSACPRRLRGQYTRARNGTAPDSSFRVNGRDYKRGYYLSDGIYNKWSTLVKAYPYPTDPKEKRFKKLQEAARKDVERAFGVLKGKWKILQRPLRPQTKDKIGKYVHTCIILHNMIIKRDEKAISPVHIMDPLVQPVFDESVYAELIDEEVHHRL